LEHSVSTISSFLTRSILDMFKSLVVVLFTIAMSCFACSKPESKSDEVIPGDNITQDATVPMTLDATPVVKTEAPMDATPVVPVQEKEMSMLPLLN
jgi:hypothetical protein